LRKTQTFERERIMTADEIRETNYGEVAYLREIAAQIAELNENIKLMQQSHTVLRETDDNDIGF
jgi:D-ribose pyranose/furanose isomerase RbsD